VNVFQSGERCGAWLIATVARDRCAANAQTSSSKSRCSSVNRPWSAGHLLPRQMAIALHY
jgi:hypothetical protein